MSIRIIQSAGAMVLALALVSGQQVLALHCERWISPAGDHPWDRHGSHLCHGDVNGDGFADVVVGAHLADANGDDSGRVWVYYGGPTPDDVPDLIMTGEGRVDHFGSSVSSGDLDGDGYDDLLVGAQICDLDGNNAGRAYLFRGGPTPDTTPDLVYHGLAAGDWFGCCVSMGDIDGDGYADAIVGGGMPGAGPGKVVIYRGGAAPDAEPDLILLGEAVGDEFGRTVACVGDVDGDGHDDIEVGARFNDAGGTDAGRVYVFLGGEIFDTVPDLVITGTTGARLGAALFHNPGDWNGDGHDDVVVGDYFHPGGGRVLVFLGSADPDADVDVIIPATNPALRLGHFTSFARDLTGNGHDDLLVAATTAVEYGPEPAAVHVFEGGAAPEPTACCTILGDPGEGFGVGVTDAGDVNGDGHRDFAAGAIWWAENTGRAHVYACRPTRTWHVPADAPTIQAGIDSAGVGDVVAVACGVYLEHDLVMESGITLRSETGRADCVTIDAQQLGRVMQGVDLDTATAVTGITFTGGDASHGGGFHGADCALTITDCVFVANTAGTTGGGLFLSGGAPILQNVTVAANQAEQGGGLCLVDCPADLTATLVAFNAGESITCSGGVPRLSCCDLFGNTGGDWIGPFADQVVDRGNFGADPCFCDLEAGSLFLCADSFCLPGHHPWGCDDLVGALDTGCAACDCAGPVPCRLLSFTAVVEDGAVVLAWRVAPPGTPEEFRIEGRRGARVWTVPVNVGIDGAYRTIDRSEAASRDGWIAYRLSRRDDDGDWRQLGEKTVRMDAPLSMSLEGGHPNPFNPRTTVTFVLPRTGRVDLAVHALDGRRLATLVATELEAGRHVAHWDGRDASGRRLASGSYLVRLVADGATLSRGLTLVR